MALIAWALYSGGRHRLFIACSSVAAAAGFGTPIG
jgi:di/tricarboxylate transporter